MRESLRKCVWRCCFHCRAFDASVVTGGVERLFSVGPVLVFKLGWCLMSDETLAHACVSLEVTGERAQQVAKDRADWTKFARQRGFSLVEVSMVTALMILIAIIGIPAVQGYVIENKVPRVAEDLQRFIARLKVSAVGAGAAPYARVDQRALVNGLRDAAAIQLLGKGSNLSVAHGLGGVGVGSSGTISIRSAAVPGFGDGSGFKLILSDVNHAACPALATVLQRMALQVTISGIGPAVEVKNSRLDPAREYDPVLADVQCKPGDSNTFEFVFQ